MTIAETINTARTADLGWITLGYDDVGPTDAGSDTVPMILLHGAGAGATSRSNFVANIPVLAEDSRVIALDLPGFGRSDAYVMTTEARTTVSARAIDALMAQLGIEKANFLGNSLGGGTAMTVAVDFPERVNRMVLMGCSGPRPPLFGATPTEGIKALLKVYRERTFENFRAFFDIMIFDGSTVPDDVLRRRADSVRDDQVHAWLESMKSPLRSLAGELQAVQAPTLIMHGRQDRTVAFEGALALLSELPNSELHAFNRCGHWVQYEHAEVFNTLVLEFLTRS